MTRPLQTVAVRALCEFAARAGDLDLRFTPAPSALEGIAGHALVQGRRGPGYEAEIALAGAHGEGARTLRVRGRADGYDPAANRLEEIKTHRGPVDGVRPHHRALHWAQAKVYGHLLCEARGLARLNVALVYFELGSEAETVLVETHDAPALKTFFEALCARYLSWALAEEAHRQARDAALARLAFPLGGFRAGQREMAVAVYRAARASAGACLMVQAPTGIGKTMGTLFPLLKASPPGTGSRAGQGLDKLFFLTAKGTGEDMALRALDAVDTQLRAEHDAHAAAAEPPSSAMADDAEPARAPTAGQPALLRVLSLKARDKSCEHPDKACHGESCPLAQGFFDRLPAAREAVVRQHAWRTPALREVALAHGICPYHLSHELVRWADVVVGDYNHWYDTSALLYALTRLQGWQVGVLVDEAHNLPERARRMYTAELLPATLAAARQSAHGPVKRALDRLRRVWREGIGDDDEPPGHAPHPVYRACDTVPPRLLAAVQGVVQAIAQVQADEPALLHAAVQDMHFEALHFIALAESFGPHALFDSTQPPSGDARADRAGLPPTPARPVRARASGAGEQLHIPTLSQQYPSISFSSSTEKHAYPDHKRARSSSRLPTLCIRNVIPAPYLAERHAAARVSVLFSGTLGPPGFYRDLLGLPEGTPWLDVPAPFAASQLAVHVVPAVSTRWRDRARSLTPIADLVARQWRGQPGNYLCFFSSFDYLRQAAARMRERHPDLPLLEQSPAMDDAARAAFLARFVEGGQAIGFVVLGGAFSEGVDLPGSRLVGAFVATLGLPQFNPVNEQMRHAMAGRFGAARADDYTYLYPGLRKVVQAAGRVIRTEHDRGTVHLIDDRYARPAVQALLPAWWRLRADDGSAGEC